MCRHHAAILAEGCGTASCFRCPYHGWTYGLDGRLQRATRLRGIQGFRATEHGLLPLAVEQWGGFVWVRQAEAPAGGGQQQQQQEPGAAQGVAAWLGRRGSSAALAAGVGDELAHVASREYRIECNWKVFADNYLVSYGCCTGCIAMQCLLRRLRRLRWLPAPAPHALRCQCRCCACCCSRRRHCLLLFPAAQDGGYHVSVAHPELASGLDLPTYRSSLFERLSIQGCQPAGAAAAGAAGTAGTAGEQQGGTSSSSEEQSGQLQRRLGGGRPPAYVFVYPNLMLNRQARSQASGWPACCPLA